jgi:TolB-like protein/DNA-binding winged helix-turn-helix (wHTH) protein
MQQAELSVRNFKFGVFEADLRTGELTKLGRRVRLQDQPFQLLAMLLEKPGALVTREELHLQLWPETTVDFDHGLNKAISKIREALGDSAENPRFIETVARRGYRFLADVTVVGAEQPKITVADEAPTKIAANDLTVQRTPDPPRLSDTVLPPRWKLRSFAQRMFGIIPVLAISLSAIFYPWTHAAPTIHSIVVLPLQNFSSDASQQFFADGMTDELITNLAQIRRLRVVSSALALGYKGTRQPLGEIARELNVDAVVKGSVLLSGDRVRINARLIDVSTERDVWAQSYEGDVHDTLKLQSEIASEIVKQFRIILNQQERTPLNKSMAENPDADGSHPRWGTCGTGEPGIGRTNPSAILAMRWCSIQTTPNHILARLTSTPHRGTGNMDGFLRGMLLASWRQAHTLKLTEAGSAWLSRGKGVGAHDSGRSRLFEQIAIFASSGISGSESRV